MTRSPFDDVLDHSFDPLSGLHAETPRNADDLTRGAFSSLPKGLFEQALRMPSDEAIARREMQEYQNAQERLYDSRMARMEELVRRGRV